ncbi:MAG: hypothetical protein WAL02_15160, partial [Rhodoplanes sp.]
HALRDRRWRCEARNKIHKNAAVGRDGIGRWRKRRGNAMKIILSAVAIVALLAGPCYAQVNYGQGKTGTWSERVEEGLKIEKEERERKLDAQVKAAGDKIPEPKVKFDPWKNAR